MSRHAVGPKPFGRYWVWAVDLIYRETGRPDLEFWWGEGEHRDDYGYSGCGLTVWEVAHRIGQESHQPYYVYRGRLILPHGNVLVMEPPQ